MSGLYGPNGDLIEAAPRTFFTVLVSLRNCSQWIGECLDSLLMQTFPSWNAIVCDDASDDGSLAIIEAKVGADPRFTIIRNAARLTALPNLMHMTREATGDHCAILDGDDAFLRPDALDIIFAVYNDSAAICATSGQYVCWPNGRLGHCSGTFPGNWFDQWPYGHTLTYRRSVCLEMMDRYPQAYLDIATGRPYTTTYDLALYYPVAAWAEWNDERIAHINIPNYLYRRWEQNDDATQAGLAHQTLTAKKIQLYWCNEMFRHDAMLRAQEA